MTATEDTWSSLVPDNQMQPFQDIWNQLSRRAIFPVADDTERDIDLPAWLASKGMTAPSTDDPLYVHNKSMPSGMEMQSTVDGTNWATHNTNVPFAISAGTVGITMDASSTGSASVTFPAGRFTQPPRITLAAELSGYAASFEELTKDGMAVTLRHIDGSSPSLTRSVNWIAVQMTSTSASG